MLEYVNSSVQPTYVDVFNNNPSMWVLVIVPIVVICFGVFLFIKDKYLVKR